jgi:hypothetical protein
MNFEMNFNSNQKNNFESTSEIITVIKDWEDPDLPEEFEAEKKTVEFKNTEKAEGEASYLIFEGFGYIPREKIPDFEKIRPGDKFEVFTKVDTVGNNPVADIVMVKNLSTGKRMTTADWKESN